MRSAPIVRYAALSGFASVCREVGVDHRALMRRQGLDPDLLDQPDAWAPAADVASVMEAAALTSGCPTLGLRMSLRRTMTTLGPISLVLTEEPTLREALLTLTRFWPAYNEALRLRLVDRGATTSAITRFGFPAAIRHTQAVELVGAVVCSLAAPPLGTGGAPHRVTFRHGGPPDAGEHERILGTRVEFGAPTDSVEFDAAALDTPRPVDDPQRRIYARQYLAALAAPGPEDRVEKIRGIVEDLLPVGRCSADRVATSLGVDRRTVHRWLRVEGQTFTDLVSQVRQHRAERYLGSGLSITETAERLGFTEVSSFSRWFAGQYGTPPSRWRSPEGQRLP
ncbi:AraC-like DNA-binding protein [Kineosphaera limosa]|uniref:AraC family transcriptional regulator n=1 Tax=Kineosphaera limosa TaxID=111564 RepID=UPI00058D0C5D|nr:AraC family transcriptional regulator [Kineosphaera limosa]NYE01494.1 AraC-like DNA-binding protein [Kineosphaera limosa]